MPLLSSFELLIVDSNSVVHIGVKRFNVTIGLNKLVFNVVLKSIIESSLKRVRSLMNLKGKLLESRSILDSRLSLAEVIKVLLCPSLLIVYFKDFNEYVFEVSKGHEDSVSLKALFSRPLL